jgi:hypothetical protein
MITSQEHAQLADDLTGSEFGDRFTVSADLDMACDDQVRRVRRLTLFEHPLTGVELMLLRHSGEMSQLALGARSEQGKRGEVIGDLVTFHPATTRRVAGVRKRRDAFGGNHDDVTIDAIVIGPILVIATSKTSVANQGRDHERPSS